jgi:hypothetical protein
MQVKIPSAEYLTYDMGRQESTHGICKKHEKYIVHEMQRVKFLFCLF